jgi:hypothetical protein
MKKNIILNIVVTIAILILMTGNVIASQDW